MSLARHSGPLAGASASADGGEPGADPRRIDEFGYGIGRPDGILVLRYACEGPVQFGGQLGGAGRHDFLHQLFWTPDGVLSAAAGGRVGFVGAGEGFWCERGTGHDVRSGGSQTVYRVCVREIPPALDGMRAGAVSISRAAADALRSLCRPAVPEDEALAARGTLLSGLAASDEDHARHHAAGSGFAIAVARQLAHDPSDDTRIDEWARRLHISVKTLQRDFEREFGVSFSRWRTLLRLRTARVLLEQDSVTAVAYRVGYATPSAFVAAFAKEFGCTPGRISQDPARV